MPSPTATDHASWTRTYPTLGNSSITTRVCNLYPESLYQDANGLDISLIDNYATPPGGGGIGATFVHHTVTARHNGGESQKCVVDLQSSLDSGFNISQTQITQSKRINGGYADSLWNNSFSPNSEFANHPDAAGIVHQFTRGAVRIGEVNYGNAWGDFGFLADRNGPARWVSGLEFFPDWLPGSDGSTAYKKYNVSWATCTGQTGPGAGGGNNSRHWIGHLTCIDAIVGKKDHAVMLPGAVTGNSSGGGGYAWQANGNSDPANPAGKVVNMTNHWDVGLDFREATFTDAAQMFGEDQVIVLGGVKLRGHQGHLQTSANGTTWVNLT